MLESTRDQSTSRRKNRVYGTNEAHGARASAASLSSNVTSITNMSADSIATVTPESYLTSRQPARRKKRSKRRNSHDTDLEHPLPEIGSQHRNINVFEFLVDETKSEEPQILLPAEKQLQHERPQFELSQIEESQPEQSEPEDLEPDLPNFEPSESKPEPEPEPNLSEPEPKLSELTLTSAPDPEQELEPSLDPEQPRLQQPEDAQLLVEQIQFELPQFESSRPEMIALDSLESSISDINSLQVYRPSSQTKEAELEGYYRSQLSDSGISMASSFSDAHQDLIPKHTLPPLTEETVDYSACGDYLPYAPSVVDPYHHHEPQVWGSFRAPGYIPEPMPMSPASIRSYPHPYEHTHQSTPDPPSMEESEFTCLDAAPLIFRERKGKEAAQPHVFRSFAHLNARVLLQMQSNITDLEQELALLDARSVSADAHRKSRRGEFRHSRNSRKDQSLRAEIYQELHTSLEQYYDTLSSFNQVKQIASPCDATDAKSLRSWLHAHVLPTSKIDPLIGDGTDLVRLDTPESSKFNQADVRLGPCENKIPDQAPISPGPSRSKIPDEALRVIAYCVLTNIFAPLLLFKFASSILSRLILLSFTTIITTLMLDRHRNHVAIEISDLYWQCIIGCAGVSLFAATFF